MDFEFEVEAGDNLEVSLASLAEAYGSVWVWFLDDEAYKKTKLADYQGKPNWMPMEFARTLAHDALTTSFPVPYRGVWHVLVDAHPDHKPSVRVIKSA